MINERAMESVLSLGLHPCLWEGSFNSRECSLHQLAPYVGKLKSGMVSAILEEFTEPGEIVLDPFAGSGVVPLQALLLKRRTIANDLSEYAHALILGKLNAPINYFEAQNQSELVIRKINERIKNQDTTNVPQWVCDFFHPKTLIETLAAFEICNELNLHFIRACMLGILHHVRPGFLSYPASHLTPYLRTKKYPCDLFPEMYKYRDVASRLRSKVKRAYRRPATVSWASKDFRVDKVNSTNLPYPSETVDTIISSPPYFGALDYARDNRLRLWFLGIENWRDLDKRLTASQATYLPQMKLCLLEMFRVLKPGAHCILVLGDVIKNGKMRETAEIISNEAMIVTNGQLKTSKIIIDEIPDDRRSRRRTTTTKLEKILVMRKCR